MELTLLMRMSMWNHHDVIVLRKYSVRTMFVWTVIYLVTYIRAYESWYGSLEYLISYRLRTYDQNKIIWTIGTEPGIKLNKNSICYHCTIPVPWYGTVLYHTIHHIVFQNDDTVLLFSTVRYQYRIVEIKFVFLHRRFHVNLQNSE